jgi:8-oxo-dGTP pyrophosphatase MutT (NUDIX family)
MLPYLIAGAIGYGIAKIFEEDKSPKYADGGTVLLAPNGKPSKIILWHGSDSDIDMFDYNKILDRSESHLTNFWGYGIYFTNDKSQATEYGKHLYSVVLSDDADILKGKVKQSQLNKIWDGLIREKRIEKKDYEREKKWFLNHEYSSYDIANDTNEFHSYFLRNKYKLKNSKDVSDFFLTCGIDGMSFDNGIYVIFNDKILNNLKKIYSKGGTVLLAPNGKPSKLTPEQYKLVRTPAFKQWFGDWQNDPVNSSKVVDSNGEPLVCYHGTYREFTSFDINKVGNTDKGFFSKGFYFSPIKNVVYYYGNKVYECFLNIKNPITTKSRQDLANYLGLEYYHTTYSEIARDKIVSLKYDGVFVEYNLPKDVKALYPFMEIVAYYPEQIKLADGTNTTFDGNNPDIRFDNGGEADEPTNFWGTEAGGVLVYCSTTDRYLILLRSEWVLEPNTWGIISGKLDDDETNIEDAVLRESEEETGHKLGDLIPSFVFEKPNFKFHNFVSIIEKEFVPELNWENTDYKWVKLNEMPDNLHFGLKLLLQKEDMQTLVEKNKNNTMNKYNPKDEVTFNNLRDGADVDDIFVAFEPNQIKLADGTNTTFDSNNSDIRFNDGGLTNYTEFWNNLVIEDGSKYIGRKFGDVFPFLKGGFSTPFKYKLKVKQYNNYLKRLSEDNYTTKSKRQADLNKIERNKKYIYKVKYLSEFYIDNTGTIIDFKHNNDIRFDGGGEITNYIEFYDNLQIEDGSKYIGRKFANVFPFIGKRTSPAEYRISVKEYNKLLSRLENDNYTTKGMKTADLNRLEKRQKYINKKKYLSRFYLDPSGTIISFDNSYL